MKKFFRKSNISIFKIITIIASLIVIIFTLSYYTNYKYMLIRDNFYSEFNKLNFNEAKDILAQDNIYLKLKKNTLNKDLNTYFSSVTSKVCNGLLTNEINKADALTILNEIKGYKVLNSSLDKLILSLDDNYIPTSDSDYKLFLELGVESYKNNNFTNAINLLRKIPSSSTECYNTANSYIDKSIVGYKNQLFTDADKLVKDDYYTKAIELLSNADTSIITSDDADIKNKINSISDARDNYLLAANNNDDNSISTSDSEDNQTTSASILQSITSQNINTLNIESLTSTLIYVNLNNQMTYVYDGYVNNWNLINEFPCSTGIQGEDTPSGIFTVLSRGDWFFSDDYGQGGKYWVQFLGDYLFHSLPYDETQENVLDYTLGTPASHGCIRLKTEDAKWIYDNVLNGTKVIIN